MKEARRYDMKKRAEALEDTRRRITQAAVDLHRTVGPAATRITEIAERAGVQRATVYNHFPDEATLLASCSAHWRSLHPTPDPAAWAKVTDEAERLRTGLFELYSWYRETEPMTANVLRDAELIPALKEIITSGLGGYLERVCKVFTEGRKLRGRRRERVEAAARVAIDFQTWRKLAHLGDNEAAEMGARIIESAALD
jgi:AcrR family transcriptional regulator